MLLSDFLEEFLLCQWGMYLWMGSKCPLKPKQMLWLFKHKAWCNGKTENPSSAQLSCCAQVLQAVVVLVLAHIFQLWGDQSFSPLTFDQSNIGLKNDRYCSPTNKSSCLYGNKEVSCSCPWIVTKIDHLKKSKEKNKSWFEYKLIVFF